MKNEKNKSQDKDQLRNQQQGTQTEQQQKLRKEQRTGREEDELEDSEFTSEQEDDDVEQGRSGDKFGKQKGRQQDPTKSQKPSRLKDEYQGGSGKGIDVD